VLFHSRLKSAVQLSAIQGTARPVGGQFRKIEVKLFAGNMAILVNAV
jgi:hypothetical protein